MTKRTFSPEFKRESARLVVDKKYSITDACAAVGVSDNAMRKWVKAAKGGIQWHNANRKSSVNTGASTNSGIGIIN